MSDLILENNYLKITFPGTKAGFSGIWAKGYNRGSAIPTDWNRLNQDLQPELLSGDYHGIYTSGSEYWSDSFSWFAYKTTMSSRDLYGSSDMNSSPVQVEVVKCVSGDTVSIGNDRAISGQEVTYTFTPDGKGLIKRVRLQIKKLGSQADSLQSVMLMDYVGFSPISSNSGCKYYSFGERRLGFDYNSLADFQADWTVDTGLDCSIARLCTYPNLLPGFTSAEWQVQGGNPSIIDDGHMSLSAGDAVYICHHNAYPANRVHTLRLGVQGLTGGGETPPLRVKYGLSRTAIAAEDEAQTLDVTGNGVFALQDASGYGDNWLFLKLEQISGSCQVVDSAVKYLADGLTYIAPDSSYLAHSNLNNCIRVQSANPNSLRLIHNFASNVKIAAGKAVKLFVLSLDNTSIENEAFRIIFQKPDNSWVESEELNMFVDYNDKYPKGSWGRFNLWEDGFFGVSVPDGVDEIKAIGIQWITGTAIDWLLDGFGIVLWDDNDTGIGAKRSSRLGLSPIGLRQDGFTLQGMQGAYHVPDTNICQEGISVLVVEGTQPYGEYVPLTFQNSPSVSWVYQIGQNALDNNWGDWQERSGQLVYDASGIANYLYPLRVENITRNEEYIITQAAGNQITVDIAQQNHSLSDTLRITYAQRQIVDSSHWSVQQNARGQWCIKWAYDNWTAGHNHQAVYVDYSVASRTDDSIACVVGGSHHDVNRLVQHYYDSCYSPALLATYSTLVFSDPANEVAETFFIYQPVLNKTGDALYAEAETVHTLAENLYAKSRVEPLSPAPRNYNLMPHIAFGGEYSAANPVEFLQIASSRLYQANATNAIISSGSLTYLRDRDLDAWYWWGGALLDNGVDFLTASRNILRRGYSESQVSHGLNRHRYLFELVLYGNEVSKRRSQHASVDYKGDTSYLRIWYYQSANNLYTAVSRAFDDFDSSYYNPVFIDGVQYDFQYHYIEIIPIAFWSLMTPASSWGYSAPNFYDLLSRRLAYLCSRYDCEGVLLSELIYYGHSYSANDLVLYNQWRISQGQAALTDWPRDAATGYVMVDDPDIWAWKSAQVKQFLTDMAAIAHSHNKLLGVDVEVQNVIPVKFPQASVWDGYQKLAGPYGTCVNTLDYSCSRYGTVYEDLLKENICDLFFVWLYYRYSSFGMSTVDAFTQRFADYKERMLITVGLFPKEDPPPAEEVIQLVQDLLRSGWNVAYAGYPPMLLQDEQWAGVWDKFTDYVPLCYYNAEGQIEGNPKKMTNVPFLVRF